MLALPPLTQLLTLRNGAIAGALTEATPQREQTDATRILCLDDCADATLTLAEQMQGAAACPVWITAAAAATAGAARAFKSMPLACSIVPIATAATDAQAELKRLSQQHYLPAARIVLQLTADSAAALPIDRVRALEAHGAAWLVHVPSDHATSNMESITPLLQSLLAHSTLPVLLAAHVDATAIPAVAGGSVAPNATPIALRLLDSLASLPSLHQLSVSFAAQAAGASAAPSTAALPASLNVDLLHQHWTAMRQREIFRANLRARQAEQVRPSSHDASGCKAVSASSASVSAGGTVSAVAAAAVPPAAPATANFYRAAFTPTTMFYRIAILFSPAVPLSDLTCYGLLSDAIRSLLGTVGLSKSTLQLLQWNSATGSGVVSSSAEMSIGVRAAWMLMGGYQGQTCRIDVQQQSLFLQAIATEP